MKQTGILGVLLLLFLPAMGCVCHPGYSTGCNTGACGVPLGCGSLLHNGVVDYVNGPPGGTEADCGACTNACSATACGAVSSGCGSYVGGGGCLGTLGEGIRVLGDGAFTLAATPFIVAGNIVTGGGRGYETYGNCGCSNEVYYGDNCYQPHDFCDPCAGSCDPCGCGTSVATSGCARCAGGYQEGIQYENSDPKHNAQPTSQPKTPQKMSRPTPTPVRSARAVTQTSYQRQHPAQTAQRIVPPQPQRARSAQPLPPKTQTIAEDAPVLPPNP